jgi:hypothetical protein
MPATAMPRPVPHRSIHSERCAVVGSRLVPDRIAQRAGRGPGGEHHDRRAGQPAAPGDAAARTLRVKAGQGSGIAAAPQRPPAATGTHTVSAPATAATGLTPASW